MYEAVALLATIAFAAGLAIRYRSLPAKIPQYFSADGTAAFWPRWYLWIGVALIVALDVLTYTGAWSAARTHPNTSWLAVTVVTAWATWAARYQGDVAVGKRPLQRPPTWISLAFMGAYAVTVVLGPSIIG